MNAMELGSLWSQARAVHPDDQARQNESFMAALGVFAELATAKERAARIEAQHRLADMQELAAKSGLAHRKAVQAAVAEAVAEERDACALVCDELFVPVQVLGAHPDYLEGKHMAKSQCSAAIRARGTP